MSETFDLRIDSIAAGGDGVGRHGTMVVFVPRTARGDVARVEAVQEGRLMRGSVLDLLTRSPERVAPECPHYVGDRCGGCQIQHVGYEAQLAAKSGIIADSLTRIGRVEVALPEVVPSSAQWRYRTKLTLALRRRGSGWYAGLRQFDDPDAVFDLEDCPITDDRVMAAWRSVLAHQRHFPSANELRGAVRLLGEGFSFTLEGASAWPAHEALFQAMPDMLQLWWRPEEKSRRLVQSRLADAAGASFTQVNPPVAAAVRDWVMALAAETNPKVAVDAYAGTGDIAVALAERGARVTAIEIDRDASRVCASRLPPGSRAVAAPVEDALPKAMPADLVVLNPPRAGLDERVTSILKAEGHRPKAVIYVSCNPATLARDVRRLEGYRVRSLRGFDMFPQTAHVETVCELVPAA